jgi:hypothetical protein
MAYGRRRIHGKASNMKLLAESFTEQYGGIFARNVQPPFELLDRGNLAPFFFRWKARKPSAIFHISRFAIL